MQKLKNNKCMVIVLNITIVFGFVWAFVATRSNTIEIMETSNVKQISNQKICWGIKKNDNHEQPDVGSNNKKILEENNGMCMGNKEEKILYITFDNGYEAGYTNQILDVLKKNEVKATFFITAHYLNTAPELVQRMIDEGHIVGNQFPTMVMYHI